MKLEKINPTEAAKLANTSRQRITQLFFEPKKLEELLRQKVNDGSFFRVVKPTEGRKYIVRINGEPDMLTVSAFAALCGVAEQTVRYWTGQGARYFRTKSVEYTGEPYYFERGLTPANEIVIKRGEQIIAENITGDEKTTAQNAPQPTPEISGTPTPAEINNIGERRPPAYIEELREGIRELSGIQRRQNEAINRLIEIENRRTDTPPIRETSGGIELSLLRELIPIIKEQATREIDSIKDHTHRLTEAFKAGVDAARDTQPQHEEREIDDQVEGAFPTRPSTVDLVGKALDHLPELVEIGKALGIIKANGTQPFSNPIAETTGTTDQSNAMDGGEVDSGNTYTVL
jgi:hypothetical protein